MKTYSANLLGDVVGSYDKTKTTIAGRVSQKTINSNEVLGPPLTKFIDVYTDTLNTFIPGQICVTANNRMFILQSAPATGVANQIALYTFNTTTGAYNYVGKILFSIAAPATITITGFKVDDTNTSNIKILIGYRSTTGITGGVNLLWKIALGDFVPVGPITVYTALASDAKAVYNLQLPLEQGGAQAMTTVAGLVLPYSSSDSNINTKLFAHNGVSATHQYYIFDLATAPTMAAGQTTTAATSIGSPTFTMTGHGYQANDPVVITANAPTAFTATGAATPQTIYYVRATNLTANTFELSATSGGAAINATSVTASTVFVRALGTTTNQAVAKTANLPSLGAGTLLISNSENYCVPGHTANSGLDCAFFTTTTIMYLGKLLDLFSQQTGTTNATTAVTGLSSTAGLSVGQTVFGAGIPAGTTIAVITGPTTLTLSQAATTSTTQTLTFGAVLWPNLVNANVNGNGTDYVIPVPVNAVYSTSCDAVFFSVAGIYSLIKRFQNNVILGSFGVASNIYLEAQSHTTVQFSLQTILGFGCRGGWIFASCITTPQRGIVAMDMRSDALFEYSYIVTPVMPAVFSTLKAVSTLEELFDSTASVQFQYRTGATASDAVFNTATTGWIDISTASDLSALTNDGYVQFRMMFAMATGPSDTTPSVTTPAQLAELLLTTQPSSEISDNWDYSYDASSPLIPTRVGFKLRQAYAASVPTMYFRAHDETGNVLTTANTVTHASNFEYSTDEGDTWNPLGTVPNTVGTMLRYTFVTPPGVNIRVSLRES